jgi:hypothetical protein
MANQGHVCGVWLETEDFCEVFCGFGDAGFEVDLWFPGQLGVGLT